MPQDLRTYLDLLISTYPDQLKVVSSRVDPEFEATAIVDRIEDDPARYPGFPAVLFKDVGGASMPVLLNLHATYERLALSIGTDVKGMVPEYAAREGKRIPTSRWTRQPRRSRRWSDGRRHRRRAPADAHPQRAGRGQIHHLGVHADEGPRLRAQSTPASSGTNTRAPGRSASRSTRRTTPATSSASCGRWEAGGGRAGDRPSPGRPDGRRVEAGGHRRRAGGRPAA